MILVDYFKIFFWKAFCQSNFSDCTKLVLHVNILFGERWGPMWGFSIHRTWDSGARLPRYIKLAKSNTTRREIRNLFCGFTLIPQNWYWPFQVQCHTQAACSSPVCLFQEQERRHRQWQWGQGSCRRPRQQRGRGTWRGRSRWTSPRSWECQEFHTRMYRPSLLN